jgi:lipid-A-disaccharide synthase
MLEAAALIHRKFPRTQFLLGQASSLDSRRLDQYLQGQSLAICRIQNNIYSAMKICDVAIVASGTATLELALLEVPMVIVYRVSSLTYYIGRTLIRVPSIGLANLVSGKRIVPELIQGDVTGERIVKACVPFFTNAIYVAEVKKELKRVRTILGYSGASQRAAEIICGML